MGDIKIILTLIVQENEDWKPCITATAPILDGIVICSTGKIDDVIGVSCPLRIHSCRWEDLVWSARLTILDPEHQREDLLPNQSIPLTMTKQLAVDLQFDLEHTYALLLDPSMILEIGSEFKKESLSEDSYLITQYNEEIHSTQRRLVKLTHPWQCVGVTNDCWETEEEIEEDVLSDLRIRCSAKTDPTTLTRNIHLLTEALRDDPKNPVYMLKLAQSYQLAGKYAEALQCYQKCNLDKDWEESRDPQGHGSPSLNEEEIWYCYYMSGECHRQMSNWPLALEKYLDAYQSYRHRAEPLHQIAHHYRNIGKNELAVMFSQQGLRIPYPTNDLIQIEHPVYTYKLLEELSISAFYTTDQDIGFDACESIMLSRTIPSLIKDQTFRNEFFYISALPTLSTQKIEVTLPLIKHGSSERYRPLNPSLVTEENGYTMILRSVNYESQGTTFKPLGNDLTNRSRNFLLRWSPELTVRSMTEIIDPIANTRVRYPARFLGMEDCRLFKHQGHYWFTCTTLDTNPLGIPQITLCRLSNEYTIDRWIPLQGPDPRRCEKNWAPFDHEGQINIIYSYGPTIIYRPDLSTGRCDTIVKNDINYDLSRFRGSTSPIPFDDGYLLMTHEVIRRDRFHYVHRFVWLDTTFNIRKLSRPFYLLQPNIEFCSGLGYTCDHQAILISAGINDCQAYIFKVDLDVIRRLLRPFPS